MNLFLILIFLLLSPSAVFGADYFVDCTSGNDSAAGTSQGAAWLTLDKVETNGCSAGDTISVKRGTTCTMTTAFEVPCSGSSGNYVTFNAYGSGDDPIITTRGEISGWNVSGNWTDYSGTIPNSWYMTLASTPGRLFINGSEALKAEDYTNVDSTYKWFHGTVAGSTRLLIYSVGNPATTYSSIEAGGVVSTTVNLNADHYVAIRDWDIQGGSTRSLQISKSNYFDFQNGSAGKYSQYGIVSQGDIATNVESNYGVLKNLVVDSAMNFHGYNYEFIGTSDGVDLRTGSNFWEIDNIDIRDWGHTGLLIRCDSSAPSMPNGSTNNTVTNITISAENLDYGRGIATQHLDDCEGGGNEFGYIRISDTKTRNQINGNNDWFHDIIIENTTRSPVYRSVREVSEGIQIAGDSGLVASNNILENITMVNIAGACINLHTGSGKHDKQGNIFRNIICSNTGLDPYDSADNDIAINIENGADVLDNTYQNILVYSNGESSSLDVVNYRGTEMTIAEFNLENGSNSDVISNNLYGNPSFVNESVNNYKLKITSSAINAATHPDSRIDFAGTRRPDNEGGDIGAYEFNSGISFSGITFSGVN